MSEADEKALDFFPMTNLRPASTGLPMVVWVSERGLSLHDVRLKVSTVHGSRLQHANVATVALRPASRLVAGKLSPADLQAVGQGFNSTRQRWWRIGIARSTPPN